MSKTTEMMKERDHVLKQDKYSSFQKDLKKEIEEIRTAKQNELEGKM